MYNRKKTGRKTKFGFPAKSKEEFGFIGEYIVFQNLLAKEKDVQWVSENARKAGVERHADAGDGYDITYLTKQGKTKYVEVKVVGNDDSFHISQNEVLTGEEFKNHYEIFLVRNPQNPENLCIEKLTNIFKYRQGQSFNDNDNFSVANDSYILKFKRKE